MPIPSHITDPRNSIAARVTEFGQLVTSAVAYSIPVTDVLDTTGTAFNYIEPEASHQIVITDIILTTDKNVGVNGASVQIYCASAIDSTTVLNDGGVLDIEMLKNTSRDLIGLNFLVTEGFWVNAKTDDANIQLTIGYYRVPID